MESTFRPTTGSERLLLIDALRGAALLGIVIANIPMSGDAGPVAGSLLPTGGTADTMLKAIMHVLVSTKFITLFSMLFGAGCYLQLNKAAQGGVTFRSYFAGRMVVLLCIGLLHGYLLWFGDIIRYYAVCGLLLLLFYRYPLKKILIWAVIFLVPLTGLTFIFKEALGAYPYDYSIVGKLFATPSYRHYLTLNFTIDPIRNFIYDAPLTLVSCFGKVLLGYWLAAKGFFSRPEQFGIMRLRWLAVSGALGFAASIGYWAVSTGRLELTPGLIWLVFAIAGGLVLHSLFYLGLFALLFRGTYRKLLLLFAPLGKMSMTNYLMQTVMYLLLFYAWTGGPNLFGKAGTAETYLLAVGIFLLQMAYSHLWMRRHKQGPVEYCWKKLVYNGFSSKSKGPTELLVPKAVQETSDHIV